METDNKKDVLFAMLCFAVIGLLLIFLMINSFHVVDCCYFIVVVLFAARYFALSRD